jgi:hypothetical protein
MKKSLVWPAIEVSAPVSQVSGKLVSVLIRFVIYIWYIFYSI